MKNAKILDCTLRDGAYLIDKNFGNVAIKGIISGLVETGIEYVEIGFLQDEGYGEGKTVFADSCDAGRFVPEDKRGSLFTLLADCSRYSIDRLEPYNKKFIDGIRECFFKKERAEAFVNCKKIKEKGYLLFIQPVDILGYSDAELIQLIEEVNQIEPYCFSIVDTFGSMYIEDIERLFYLVDHNLNQNCKIGFHSHNNLQMSNALSQEIIRLSNGKREIIVDGTISGMGRGAGNTPTELLVQYINCKMNGNYKMDALLDIIDGYMGNIKSRCSWGYNTPFFIAGCYGAHVNNVTYLEKKTNIRYKDVRYILNKIGNERRKRYDYGFLEDTLLHYAEADIDDTKYIDDLRKTFFEREVVVLAPGRSIREKEKEIKKYIETSDSIILAINFIPEKLPFDYLFIGNVNRYEYWKEQTAFKEAKKIIVSNVVAEKEKRNDFIVSYTKLIKCGWEHFDNSIILLLRLLDKLGVKKVSIAGFDGYDYRTDAVENYYTTYLEVADTKLDYIKLNDEIKEMLEDYINNRKNSFEVKFITESRFAAFLE